MNILIDIGHPAHVHLFKYFAHEMEARGHRILFTCRNRSFVPQLLVAEGFKYRCIGKRFTTTCGRAFGFGKFILKIILISIKFRPEFFLSHGSMYAAVAAFFFKKTSYFF